MRFIPMIYLAVASMFGVTVSEKNTTLTPVSITLTVPHDKLNDIACAGVNDRKDYIDFPNQFTAFVCWNVNLEDFPDIPEQFEQVFAPLDAGTYYVGGVLYLKPGYPGGKRPEPKLLPLVPFTVSEVK